MKRIFRTQLCLLLALLLFAALPTARAETVSADAVYCFTGEEFSAEGVVPEGVYIAAVPPQSVCRLLLGERVILPGDVLPAETFAQLRLAPACDETADACIWYLPITDGTPGERTCLTMQIKSTKNEAPHAEDVALETYRNIANTGRLAAMDPEEDALCYQLVERPKRGTAELLEDGSFVYTPKKNKLGEDRFTYTATDAAGNVSNVATVRVTILQPLEQETFDDLAPTEQFPAMWLREQGLFGGTRVTDKLCFAPDAAVSRGEFLAMAMELAAIPQEIGPDAAVFSDEADAPGWLLPYLHAALRRGIVQGYASEDGLEFRPNQPITAAEAAAIVTRCFRLESAAQTDMTSRNPALPAWAEGSAQLLRQTGIDLIDAANEALCRQDAAALLYETWRLS